MFTLPNVLTKEFCAFSHDSGLVCSSMFGQFGKIKYRNAQVVEQHKNQIQLLESDLLNYYNQIRHSSDLLDKISLVQLCVGSRFIEVLKVSEYEESKKFGQIVVRGVAKNKKEIKENRELSTLLFS